MKKKSMGSEAEDFSGDPTSANATTPTLSLFSLPYQHQPAQEPSGMLTPPLRPPASVPFNWEEAPGKPRPTTGEAAGASVSRCLELPPRLLLYSDHGKITNMPSPTTVLDGPYIVGRSASYSALFTREQRGSGRNSSLYSSAKSLGSPDGNWRELKGYPFGSRSRSKGHHSFLKGNYNGKVAEGSSVIFPSCSTVGGGGEEAAPVVSGGDGGSKVKITRFRRSSSFFSLSNSSTRTRLFASLFGSLKQVVPWRRSRRAKKDGCSV